MNERNSRYPRTRQDLPDPAAVEFMRAFYSRSPPPAGTDPAPDGQGSARAQAPATASGTVTQGEPTGGVSSAVVGRP